MARATGPDPYNYGRKRLPALGKHGQLRKRLHMKFLHDVVPMRLDGSL